MCKDVEGSGMAYFEVLRKTTQKYVRIIGVPAEI
jgi:hypothetical protein